MKLNPSYKTALLVGSLIGVVPAWLVAQLAELVPALQPEELSAVSEFMSEGLGLEQMIFLLLVVTMVPILEELVFRKWLWFLVEWKMSSYWTWIITSLLFAAVHMEPLHVMGLLPFSFFAGWLKHRTGKTRYSIVAHMANNAMACLLMVV
tara:strand:+ start:727 stop:1176 length:450 start_codon:yes stop_codon:yes gene_type:complete